MSLNLDPRLAPFKVAVFPLARNRPPLVELATRIADDLRANWPVFYDASGSIGRRYARQDEAGTPFAVTVDFDSLEDQTVTVRERDSMRQERVAADGLRAYFADQLAW